MPRCEVLTLYFLRTYGTGFHMLPDLVYSLYDNGVKTRRDPCLCGVIIEGVMIYI